MRNRILVIIIIILSVVLLNISSTTHSTIFFSKAHSNIKVKNTTNNEIKEFDLEEYIIGVVAAEMPASFEIEALKAQAIAARTYAVYKMNSSNGNYDVVTDVSNQGYISEEQMQEKWQQDFSFYYNKVHDAVMSTKGLVLTYNDQIIESYYFAMSNGYTEDASLVFSEKKDYLQSVESSLEKNEKNFEVTKKIEKSEFCEKLNINCTSLIIKDIIRSDTNRVNSITINNHNFKGTEIRKLLNLRSTDFTIEEDDNIIEVTTRGYGHGVGMSQYGANSLAKNGKNYEEILKYYYKNVKITTI